MARAIPVVIRQTGTPQGGTAQEFLITQPMIMATAMWPSLGLHAKATIDLEGMTIPEGELSVGAYGEGFVDRRHPHTTVHELVLTFTRAFPTRSPVVSAGVTAGPKGFAAFGTEDPMGRPAVRFPVNHHLAQLPERALVIAALRAGPVRVERSWFNGDEPERPSSWPNWRRGLDADAWRLTIYGAPGIEFQWSSARVPSPEHRAGAAPVQSKRSASVRIETGPQTHRWYALAEWARTREEGANLTFESRLVEGAYARGRRRTYVRIEGTTRPEESRVDGRYRVQRPRIDDHVLGLTYWRVLTAGHREPITGNGKGWVRVEAFAEAALATPRREIGLVWPHLLYGTDAPASLSLGARLEFGPAMTGRMGSYHEGHSPEHTRAAPSHQTR